MLNPAETAQAVSSSMEHKAHMPLTSIIFLAIMAGAAIAMGDIFWLTRLWAWLKTSLLVFQILLVVSHLAVVL